jgi:hypothetical protein
MNVGALFNRSFRLVQITIFRCIYEISIYLSHNDCLQSAQHLPFYFKNASCAIKKYRYACLHEMEHTISLLESQKARLLLQTSS